MKMVYLSSIAQVIAGQSPPSSTYNTKGEGLPFFQGKADFKDKYPVTRIWCSSTQVKIAEPSDILISVRAPVGAVNICNKRSVIGRGLSAIRAKDVLYSEYLYYFLKANEKSIAKLGTGSTFLAITQETLKKIQISLPPLEDQKRIAYLLGKVEGLIAQRKQDLQQLDDLLKSVFIDMFGDPVRNEKGWEMVELKMFGKIITGNTPPRNEPENYENGHIEWIKTDNIISNSAFITPALEKLSRIGVEKGRTVTPGALLVACIAGSLDSIGRAALTDREVAFNQQINAIQPNADVSPLYLYQLFKLSKKYIQSHATKGMKKIITKGDFEKIQMSKPPLDLQNRFAEIVEKVELIKQHYQNSLQDLEQLYGSLSQRAFKGELDLSRVPLLVGEDELPNASEPIHTELIKEPHEQQVKFQLAVPANLQDLIGKRTREQLINQWLDHYLSQLKAGKDIDIAEFIQAVNTVIGEAQQQNLDSAANSDDEPIKAFGVADYTIVQEALFARLEQQSITQVYPETDLEGSDEPQIQRVILQQSTLGI